MGLRSEPQAGATPSLCKLGREREEKPGAVCGKNARMRFMAGEWRRVAV